MSDIVERLQSLHDEIDYMISDRPDEYSIETIEPLAIVVAAITEIEGLRALLQEIRESPDALCCLDQATVDNILSHTVPSRWEKPT